MLAIDLYSARSRECVAREVGQCDTDDNDIPKTCRIASDDLSYDKIVRCVAHRAA